MGRGKKKEVYSHEQNFFHTANYDIKRNSLSGYLDSNQGSLYPKYSMITGLHYTPILERQTGLGPATSTMGG